MATRSTIMDTNSFRAEHADALDAQTRRLTDRRGQLLGESYRLFYRNPVHLVRGEGQYLWDAAGEKYLDVYNNVASIGHCHPAVIAAVHEQMSQLNTHTRYLHERILDYTADLLTTVPDAINKAMYMCTGSEANDLAIRIAKAWSGGSGIIVSQEAYHGTSELTSGASPALGSWHPPPGWCRRRIAIGWTPPISASGGRRRSRSKSMTWPSTASSLPDLWWTRFSPPMVYCLVRRAS